MTRGRLVHAHLPVVCRCGPRPEPEISRSGYYPAATSRSWRRTGNHQSFAVPAIRRHGLFRGSNHGPGVAAGHSARGTGLRSSSVPPWDRCGDRCSDDLTRRSRRAMVFGVRAGSGPKTRPSHTPSTLSLRDRAGPPGAGEDRPFRSAVTAPRRPETGGTSTTARSSWRAACRVKRCPPVIRDGHVRSGRGGRQRLTECRRARHLRGHAGEHRRIGLPASICSKNRVISPSNWAVLPLPRRRCADRMADSVYHQQRVEIPAPGVRCETSASSLNKAHVVLGTIAQHLDVVVRGPAQVGLAGVGACPQEFDAIRSVFPAAGQHSRSGRLGGRAHGICQASQELLR